MGLGKIEVLKWEVIISCVHGGLDEVVAIVTRDQVLTWWATQFKDKAWDGKLPLTVTGTLHSVACCVIVFHRYCFSFLCSFSLPN